MKRFILIAVLLALLSACGGLSPTIPTPTGEIPPTATATLPPTTVSTPAPPSPVVLRLWLPPELDPASGTKAGRILQSRLDEFASRRPDARIEVRTKAVEGPGGLVDSLTTASAAAPLSLPDLVALPRRELEAAALKGLLRPFDGLIKPIDETDWYEYARQMAHLQNSTFGVPFAGDALVMVYRPLANPEPPSTYSETLSVLGPLIFPAADPQALFTLAQYQASGGEILNEQGRPSLQSQPLNQVLEYYQQGVARGQIPSEITQYQDDEQSWQAFNTNNAPMVITWLSRHLRSLLGDTAGAPIPTPEGKPYTLATGWVWAMASPDPEHEKLSAELAEFLSEGDFLARWTSALGYLPPRASALQGWNNPTLRTLANEVVTAAQLLPSEDVLTSISPPLEQATIQILKQESDPATAAQTAVEKLAAP